MSLRSSVYHTGNSTPSFVAQEDLCRAGGCRLEQRGLRDRTDRRLVFCEE